jgi:hypothetical protein
MNLNLNEDTSPYAGYLSAFLTAIATGTLFCAGVLVAISVYLKAADVADVGFRCGDAAISGPFHSGISHFAVEVTCIFFFGLLVRWVESHYISRESGDSGEEINLWGPWQNMSTRGGPPATAVFCWIFGLGRLIVHFERALMAYNVASLSPNFLAVCQPTTDLTNCTSSVFVHNYTCAGSDNVYSAQKSFFCETSAFVFFFSSFTLFYVHFRMNRRFVRKQFLYGLYFILSLCPFLLASRQVAEQRVHTADAAFGAVAGLSTSSLVILPFRSLFITA